MLFLQPGRLAVCSCLFLSFLKACLTIRERSGGVLASVSFATGAAAGDAHGAGQTKTQLRATFGQMCWNLWVGHHAVTLRCADCKLLAALFVADSLCPSWCKGAKVGNVVA